MMSSTSSRAHAPPGPSLPPSGSLAEFHAVAASSATHLSSPSSIARSGLVCGLLRGGGTSPPSSSAPAPSPTPRAHFPGGPNPARPRSLQSTKKRLTSSTPAAPETPTAGDSCSVHSHLRTAAAWPPAEAHARSPASEAGSRSESCWAVGGGTAQGGVGTELEASYEGRRQVDRRLAGSDVERWGRELMRSERRTRPRSGSRWAVWLQLGHKLILLFFWCSTEEVQERVRHLGEAVISC